jgi:uncharacterized cupredoxin-like copper-binding protein
MRVAVNDERACCLGIIRQPYSGRTTRRAAMPEVNGLQGGRMAALAVAGIAGLIDQGAVRAEGDLTAQTPVEISVRLGDAEDALKFYPDSLSLETGKLYKLTLHNASPQKHYFSSEGMARSVFTRKVQVNGPDGKPIAEVKGQVREIEVYPGHRAEWWFVPIKTGRFDDLECTIAGHAEHGMTGSVEIR